MPGIYQNCDFNITYKQLIKFCKAGDFPQPLIKYLQQIYIGNAGEEGGFTSHLAGVLLSPMSRYQNTYVRTFLKLMIMIEHRKMI